MKVKRPLFGLISVWSFFVLVSVVLVGCGPSTYEPTRKEIRNIETLPALKLLKQRDVPTFENIVLNIKVPYQESYLDPRNFVSRPIETAKQYPSVILNIPTDIAKKRDEIGKDMREKTDENTQKNSENESELYYSTASYYNQAEQEIEKAMIRKGFNVLDRSKFEAKLRELRDSGDVEDDATAKIKKILEKRLEKGEIDTEEFLEQVRELDKDRQSRGVGQKRLNNEMIDISEVIRAADKGENQADFLLQINKMEVLPSYDRELDIYGFQETKELFSKHPELLTIGLIPRSIPRPWFRAILNAKLFEVKTGKIVWIGDHTAESNSADKSGIRILFNIQKYVKNAETINSNISEYNNQLEKKYQQVIRTYNRLLSLYKDEMTIKKFESKELKNAYIKSLEQNIRAGESELHTSLTEYNKFFNSVTDKSKTPWEYDYRISEPIITPPLVVSDNADRKTRERVEKHKSALIQEVTSKLIGTINLVNR